MSPNVLFPGRAALLGDDEHYSYIPFIMSSYTDQMTLTQRLGNAPTIAMSPNVLFPGRAALLGDDEHYSYVPFIMSSYTDQMTLTQRLGNG
uniref:Uncharacterized protein n=1 Tax=Daphnia galeata TaxID=27404 RepID=A0A8J2W3K6_9CRUS|nr:unnamed protein product [Daphnia galeata]